MFDVIVIGAGIAGATNIIVHFFQKRSIGKINHFFLLPTLKQTFLDIKKKELLIQKNSGPL